MTFDIFLRFIAQNLQSINTSNNAFMHELYEKYTLTHNKLYKYLVTSMFIKRSNMHVQFWTDRGWSEDEAKEKISNRQKNVAETIRKKRIDEKYNKKFIDTRERIKQRQINEGRYEKICHDRGNSNRWEYYIEKINPETGKNYTENESREKIHLKQRKFYDRMWKSIKNGDGIFFYNTSVDYYINKGMTYEEAAISLAERQATFSLHKCIEKYGENVGCEKFISRQNRWQSSLKNKTDAEKAEIYRKKLNNFKRYSKSSISLFERVKTNLFEKGINLTFYMGKNEKFIWDKELKTIYFYDLFIKELRMIVEYNGTIFHPKPDMCNEDLQKWRSPLSTKTGLEILEKDRRKEKLALDSGYDFMTVWEDDANAEQLLCNTIIAKYKEMYE